MSHSVSFNHTQSSHTNPVPRRDASGTILVNKVNGFGLSIIIPGDTTPEHSNTPRHLVSSPRNESLLKTLCIRRALRTPQNTKASEILLGTKTPYNSPRVNAQPASDEPSDATTCTATAAKAQDSLLDSSVSSSSQTADPKTSLTLDSVMIILNKLV